MEPTQETNFLAFWYRTLKPYTPAGLVAHWRDYELSGVARGQAVVDTVESYIPLADARVLDAGCGFGGTTIAFSLAGSKVTGIDIERERLLGAAIRTRSDYRIPEERVSFRQAMVEQLPFGEAAFDIVVCADLLEHVQSQKQAIAEISRVTRPGGIAFVSFPNILSLENLRCDPHYGLFGVSVLPRPIAAWYVVRVRRRSDGYGVGYLPVASVLKYRLRQCGMEVVFQNPLLRRNLGPLGGLARTVRTNLYPLVQWVLRKH